MWITAIVFVILVTLDQVSKYLFILHPRLRTIIPGVVDMRLSYNTGAAFGMGENMTWLWVIISILAVVVLAIIAYKNDWRHGTFGAIGVTMALAGAFGNLIDRFLTMIKLRDGVVDMICFKWFDWFLGLFGGSPNIFNGADVLLVIGIIMLAIDYIFLYERRVRKYGLKDRKE